MAPHRHHERAIIITAHRDCLRSQLLRRKMGIIARHSIAASQPEDDRPERLHHHWMIVRLICSIWLNEFARSLARGGGGSLKIVAVI